MTEAHVVASRPLPRWVVQIAGTMLVLGAVGLGVPTFAGIFDPTLRGTVGTGVYPPAVILVPIVLVLALCGAAMLWKASGPRS